VLLPDPEQVTLELPLLKPLLEETTLEDLVRLEALVEEEDLDLRGELDLRRRVLPIRTRWIRSWRLS